jgi:hypothetical protein
MLLKSTQLEKFDLIEMILEWYQKLDSRIKVAFIISFVVGVISFLPFIVHHPIHDHSYRLPWVNPLDQFHHGRWFTYFEILLLNSADIPIIAPLLTIFLITLSGILTCLTWDRDASALKLTITTLLITIYPATIVVYFYTWVSQIYGFSLFFAALSLYLTSSLKTSPILIGSVLVMLSMASYQTSLSVLVVSVLCLAISIISKEGYDYHLAFNKLIHSFLPRVMAIIFGLLLYRTSLIILDIKLTSHATQIIDLSALLSRVVEVATVSLKHLYITQPDFLNNLKIILLLVVIASIVCVIGQSALKKHKIFLIVLIPFIFLLAIIATKAMFLISSNNGFYVYRYNFALGYFYAFSFFILLTHCNVNILKNVVLAISIIVVLKYSYSLLIRQSVQLRAQMHDIAISNRILYRIESLENIDFNKKYELIRIGQYSNFRMKHIKSHNNRYDVGGPGHMDSGSITNIWTPSSVMRLLGSKVKWKYQYNPNFKNNLIHARKHLLKNRKPWPHKESVFIVEDKIYIYIN